MTTITTLINIFVMKDFRGHFHHFLKRFKNKENFAYSRFSDGELRIMQNKEVKLAADHNIIGDTRAPERYFKEDHKHFDPSKHSFYRDRLMDAYRYLHDDYYVGLSCRCCVGDIDFQQMIDWYKGDPTSPNLTWANLFLNGNYPLFMEEFVPQFSSREVVYIVNENANLQNLPFVVKKDFRVGSNCIINDFNLTKKVKKWINDNDATDHLFLFSASTLSNFLIHQLFKEFPDNTYLDIGSTLNPHLGMQAARAYHQGGHCVTRMCIW